MKRTAFFSLFIALAMGCSENGDTTLPRLPSQLSDEEKAAFADRAKRELAAARKRKLKLIAANRQALNALLHPPRAKLVSERQNPEGGDDLGTSREEQEYALYLEESLPVEAYFDVDAEGWGTFRDYANPPGASARAVYSHFLRTVGNEWRVGATGHDTGGGGRAIYTLSLWKHGRCVCVVSGFTSAP